MSQSPISFQMRNGEYKWLRLATLGGDGSDCVPRDIYNGIPMISAVDLIVALTMCSHKTAYAIWADALKLDIIKEYKMWQFPGSGQRPTPVIGFGSIVQLVGIVLYKATDENRRNEAINSLVLLTDYPRYIENLNRIARPQPPLPLAADGPPQSRQEISGTPAMVPRPGGGEPLPVASTSTSALASAVPLSSPLTRPSSAASAFSSASASIQDIEKTRNDFIIFNYAIKKAKLEMEYFDMKREMVLHKEQRMHVRRCMSIEFASLEEGAELLSLKRKRSSDEPSTSSTSSTSSRPYKCSSTLTEESVMVF
jgi:hypothetical protein